MTALKVTKIVDEMIDLETGEQFSHGIVVSNGMREEFIPLAKESLQPLVALYAETLGITPPQPQYEETPVDHVPDQVERAMAYAERKRTPEPPPEADRLAAPAPRPQLIDPRNEVEFTPAPVIVSDDEEEPIGEEYDDELTGVASF